MPATDSTSLTSVVLLAVLFAVDDSKTGVPEHRTDDRSSFVGAARAVVFPETGSCHGQLGFEPRWLSGRKSEGWPKNLSDVGAREA